MPDIETVVIGAGVVGLATARALVARGQEVLVLERHGGIGQETSSRSSEVIHAGLYYPPGSLKARFCVEGRNLLYAFARENGVSHARYGKLLVATREEEVPRLDKLAETARANGVTDIARLSADDVRACEPEVAALAALLSPSTGVIDSHALMVALEGHIRAGSGSVVLETRVTALGVRGDGTFEIQVTDSRPVVATAFWNNGRGNAVSLPPEVNESDQLFMAINNSLSEIESEQFEGIGSLASSAWQAAEHIATALEGAGIKIDTVSETKATGGPFIPISDSALFDARVRDLDAALEKLESVKEAARTAPIANPSPGHSISSNFGPRRDPFLGRLAHHSGIDFRAPPGAPVLSAGEGTVVSAGWNGGYGRMVEVDHGHGLTTRYAHMSRISVSEGDRVGRGDVVGRVGSTGRSTGPHLHFEVRRNGNALDPRPFLRAGRKIADLL